MNCYMVINMITRRNKLINNNDNDNDDNDNNNEDNKTPNSMTILKQISTTIKTKTN